MNRLRDRFFCETTADVFPVCCFCKVRVFISSKWLPPGDSCNSDCGTAGNSAQLYLFYFHIPAGQVYNKQHLVFL